MIFFAQQAVVLIGGKGARLGELTRQTPKPLMQIDASKVFLDELIELLARHGFKEILLLACHMAEQFSARYDGTVQYGARLKVLIETTPAGTAGALRLVQDYLDPVFLFANGDTLFDVNIRRLDSVLAKASIETLGVMALREVPDASRYGSVSLQNKKVTGFREKYLVGANKRGLINAGLCLLKRQIIDHIPLGPCSMEADVYPSLARKGLLGGEQLDGYFIDIGLPETLEEARTVLPARRIRPALFLDFDGVLSSDRGHTHKAEELELIPGAIDLVRAANDCGALVIALTGQAGIAQGLYDCEAVDTFHNALQARLAIEGAHVDSFYPCPYKTDAVSTKWHHADHSSRKRNQGMLIQSMLDWPIDIVASVLIGDQNSDFETASRAGVNGLLFNGNRIDELIPSMITQMTSRIEQRALATLWSPIDGVKN
jgi:D-glycero-D-manno-heptose 1,7-bisphosphate phosphatase